VATEKGTQINPSKPGKRNTTHGGYQIEVFQCLRAQLFSRLNNKIQVNEDASFEAFTAVMLQVQVFWVAVGYQRFGRPCCLHLQGEWPVYVRSFPPRFVLASSICRRSCPLRAYVYAVFIHTGHSYPEVFRAFPSCKANARV
jgi:hypothetical protein